MDGKDHSLFVLTMSLRTLLKMPRFGLFYFESDKTISVVPLCNVNRVLKGDNKTAGSIVELYYGEILLKAEIIAVGGKQVFFYMYLVLTSTQFVQTKFMSLSKYSENQPVTNHLTSRL